MISWSLEVVSVKYFSPFQHQQVPPTDRFSPIKQNRERKRVRGENRLFMRVHRKNRDPLFGCRSATALYVSCQHAARVFMSNDADDNLFTEEQRCNVLLADAKWDGCFFGEESPQPRKTTSFRGFP